MPGKMQSTMVRSLTRHIQQTQREVTILFTDIEDSTRYWGNRGDIKGRLMVDRHNRILFPLVRQFRGKVIKTIGDSVMAMFDRPEDAVSAAIAMQQALQQARDEDRSFRIRVRIGLHTGEAIVEHNDVFGDVVNVAARVESEADGDEILISGRLAKAIDKETFQRRKKGGFTPKGKHQRIALYQCDWQHHANLLQGLKLKSFTPLGSRQSLEMIGYALMLVGAFYYFYLHYLRYLLADNDTVALLALNPATMLQRYWYFTLACGLISSALLWLAMRINAIPYRMLKALKGGATGGLLFVALHSVSGWLPLAAVPGFEKSIYDSQHLFVEIQQDNAAIHQAADSESTIMMQQNSGTLLLLSDVLRNGDTVWNKVLVGEESFGWIMRIQPKRMGIAEGRVSRAEKFTLRYGDLYLLLLALPALLWGYRSFRLRPM
jgi:class 3 adenylate cyclase